jgi:2-oxo-3-hexenedioate decarboxylase
MAAMTADEIDTLARELLDLFGTGRTGRRLPDLGLGDAYAIVSRIAEFRRDRGERTVGRKIGFTNITIWDRYGVDGPMWSYVFDTTVHEGATEFDLAGLPQPGIEPEIVLHLAHAPEAGMDETDLIACIDRIAHGFEIVQSVYPGWTMTGPEAAAAFGLHGGLVIGPWHDITRDREIWADRLRRFTITLSRGGAIRERGAAANVLGGPVSALRFLVAEIARHPGSEPLRAGEIVTTGTLTDAQPVAPGETWRSVIDGLGPVTGLELAFPRPS